MQLSVTQIRTLPTPEPWGIRCYDNALERPDFFPRRRQRPCGDCAVINGLYTEIAAGCYQQLNESQRQVVAKAWDCHNGGRCEGAWLVLVGEGGEVMEYDLDDYTEYDGDGPYFDPSAGCYDDEPNDLWGEEDDLDYWLSECGLVPGQGCLKAGSEECDFECPFSRAILQPFYEEHQPVGLFAKIPVFLRSWWSDIKFYQRHMSEDYREHAHWVRYAWGLESEKYCPF